MKPGEAPFCGRLEECKFKKSCISCDMFETFKDELYKRD